MTSISVARANIQTKEPAIRIEDAQGRRLAQAVTLHGASWIGRQKGRVLLTTDAPITTHEEVDFDKQPKWHPLQVRITEREILCLDTGEVIAAIQSDKYRFYWNHEHIHVCPIGWEVPEEVVAVPTVLPTIAADKAMRCPECEEQTLKFKLKPKNHPVHYICRCGYDKVNERVIVTYGDVGRYRSLHGRFSLQGKRRGDN